jgi:PKD domain-containing protein/Big-like domain-containing protein/putative Ig domain-containing protein
MKWSLRGCLGIIALVLLASGGPARAQYIWMDSNGDGIHTVADMLNANGVPTTVDVWINTAHNRDGSTAACNQGDGDLTVWNSYAMHMDVTGGTATFMGFVNQQAGFTIGCADLATFFKTDNSTMMSACAATGGPTPNGGLNQKLFTVTVTGRTGTPSLQFVSMNSLDQNFTSFGTPCSGLDFDNTYKLGSDFFDNDGLAPIVEPNPPPIVSAPATASGTESVPISISATASDPDAFDILTLTATGQPTDLAFSSTPSLSAVTGTISGTPGYSDQGTYGITWSVTDGHSTVTATTTLVVANVDRMPVVTAPTSIVGAENVLISFTVSASDPDGEAILVLNATPLPAGASFTATALHTSGTFQWTPASGQAGPYTVTFTASNALSGTALTAITVMTTDAAPVVTAPVTALGTENQHMSFTVTASDPDHEEIGSLTAAPLPPGAIFTPGLGFTSGTFDWTPTLGMAGTHLVTFTASNALSGSAQTAIVVAPAPSDLPPTLTAPDLVSVEELGTLSFTVTASDPDGTIASLVADLSRLPSGNDAAFTTNASNTSGTLVWHPTTGMAGVDSVTFTAEDNAALMASATTAIQVIAIGAEVVGTFDWTPAPPDTGSFTVTFTAIDSTGESGTASTDITVLPGTAGSRIVLATPGIRLQTERGPIISCVSTASTDAGKELSFTVSAYPDLSSPPQARTGAQAPTAPDGTTRGPIISLTANLTALPTTNPATFTVDQDPLLTCPASVDAQPLFMVTFTVTASDPDGEPILSLTADRSMLPPGSLSTFTANATNTSGTFAWTPQPQDANVQPYPVVFTASNALYATGTTWITVLLGDRAPTAEAGGPYSGYPGAPVVFDGTASSDPDGDALTYAWDFGDGTTGVGATPSHAYASAGNYTAALTVQEVRANPLSASDNATVTIGPLGIRAFVWGGNKTIRLRSGKPSFCAQLEPANGSFQASDIDLGSIVMRYTSGGTTSEVHAMTDKSATLRDLDGNGVLEISACFAKTDLVRLFSGIVGRVQVTVDIAGRLSTTGATFSVPLTVEVVGSTGTLVASVAPNPFNPSTTLSFETPHGGPVELLVFDLAGRLVRDVTHRATYAPGIYDIRIDGLDEGGHRLASGVYFYRLATPEGSVTGRLVLMQ